MKFARVSLLCIIANNVVEVEIAAGQGRLVVVARSLRSSLCRWSGAGGSFMGLFKLERYSHHEGYLIKVVVMALAGEVAQELSPIWSWSNKNDENYS
jgi:hypothetical protein